MSALPPKADIGRECWDVRFVPEADSCSAAKKSCAGPYMRAMATFEVMLALTFPSLRNGARCAPIAAFSLSCVP